MFNLREIIIKHSESIFLIIFVGILLWMSIGPIMQYKLIHDMPMGFGACDSYAWYAYAQNIYETGNFKYTAPFMNLNLEGFSSPEPPLFMQFTAFLSYALGIPVYDTQTLLGVLLIIFSILIFFIIIREYNPFLAYLSLPLCIFSFTFPFITGLVYGVLPAIFGFVFLFASLFMLLNMNLKYTSIILGVFISAMIMGHTVRIFESIFFGGIFIILAFLFKKIDVCFIKKILISCSLAFVLSLFYLSIFKQRLFSEGEGNLSFIPSDAALYLRTNLNDFGFVKYIIILGLVLCLYFLIKERKDIKRLMFTFPITAFLLIQFLRISKVYQVTFFWPVFLSLAFGLVLFYLLQLKWFSKINKNKLTYFVISLALSLLFIYQYYYFFRAPILERISEIGAMPTKGQWDNLIWISKNTEQNSKILFFYFNDNPYDDIYHFFQSKRLSFYTPLGELDLAIKQNVIKKDYKILDNSIVFFNKRDPKFPLNIISLDKNDYLKNMSICNFDYIYGKRAIQIITTKDKNLTNTKIQSRVLYTIDLINTLLKNKNFKIVHQDDEAYIIKNNKPGGDCI